LEIRIEIIFNYLGVNANQTISTGLVSDIINQRSSSLNSSSNDNLNGFLSEFLTISNLKLFFIKVKNFFSLALSLLKFILP
jgi:hypothetical protein